ncbi:hypothetical protein A2Z33_07130 [Candidatus Gottesmanbacteria bacterium RBG_16_52_11]|uniref:Uncharacterized protein n=1 Tax=Candidatus Gottesmanbacteria bacterium RBG_16_52_11 TaxID=1798374 RepID=A0A1F5YXV7_9BACT|nr:MAG: hypothetical protein A2Z33_07130 [Candidatus Gottesmanbacteria bacterium RBG_16_52_11]
MKYHIVTFGCQQNQADSERIASFYRARGYAPARSRKQADDIIINTCMIRQSAEDRIYGLVHNLSIEKLAGRKLKIVVTGCMVGMAAREKTGRMLSQLRRRMPAVDEFLPIEEVGFDYAPVRTGPQHAWVPVSNGCNNFCTFCVVPFTRGREVSRPIEDILDECRTLTGNGSTHITLLGQNVNSYGADLVLGADRIQVMRDLPGKTYFENAYSRNPRSPNGQGVQLSGITGSQNKKADTDGREITPVYVRHLGRLRIPTLFPHLLNEVCRIDGIISVDFLSSNPWDFTDGLISVIANNPKILRHIHLPVQAGDNEVLRRMNRWYTREDYLVLVGKLKSKIPGLTLSTDIIVGFCGETEQQFRQTVSLCRRVGFTKAYISMYSDRPMTAAHKAFADTVSREEKKRRWAYLDELVNKTNLRRGTYR